MSPGKILNSQGGLINRIEKDGFHGGTWAGERVLIIESQYQEGGLDMVLESGRTHLSPGKTIDLDAGGVVVPEDETTVEFSRRYQVNLDYMASNLARIRAYFPSLAEAEM